jgi:hypothetical protein
MRKQITYLSALALFAAFACMFAGAATARSLAAPTITGFAPNHGLRGEKVTIYGHNLTGAQVQFNGSTALNVMVDPTGTHVTANVPTEIGDGPGAVTVTTPEGTATTTAMFTVNPNSKPTAVPNPRIKSFAPTSGKAGTKVTIRGAYLGGAMWVKFGGVKATFTVPTATRIVATVPKGAHSGKITLKTSGGLASSHLFKVLAGAGI